MKTFLGLILSLLLLQCSYDNNSVLSPSQMNRVDSIVDISKKITFENPDSSMVMLEQLLTIQGTKLNEKQEYEIYRQIGIIYSMRNELDSSDSLYQKAISALKGENYPCLLSSVYINSGINQNIRGNYSQAIDFYKKAEAIIENNDDKCDNNLDRIYNNLGLSYQNTGKPDSAIYYYQKAFDSAKEHGDKSMMANVLMNMAVVLYHFEDYEQAELNLIEAIQLYEAVNNKNGILGTYVNLANTYETMKDFDKALFALQKAENMANELNLPARLSSIYHNMGAVYFNQEDYAKSMIYQEKSLEIKTQYKDSVGMIHSLSSLSAIYIKTGEYRMAKESALKALNIYQRNEPGVLMLGIYNNLSEALIYLGEKESALDIIAKKEVLRDSIFSKQKTEIVQEWQVKYDTEKKEQDIIQLSERNEDQKKIARLYIIIIILLIIVTTLGTLRMRNHKKKAERQMEQLKYRTVKSKFMPHFTGNVLNSINYLIAKDPDIAQQYIAEFSEFTRQALYNSDSFCQTLKNELNYAEAYLKLEKLRFEDRLSYTIDISSEVNADTLIPTMIIHTFCENALKHGLRHKSNGEIKISVYIKEKHTIVAVEDNGIGREKAKEMNTEGNREGLKIVDQQIALLNKKNKNTSMLKIIDLFDNDNAPAGTRFELWL